MKLYLYIYCVEGAYPTDYQPWAALVCDVSFSEAARHVSGRMDTMVYEIGDATMGTPVGLLFATTEGVPEVKARMQAHPRHKVRRA